MCAEDLRRLVGTVFKFVCCILHYIDFFFSHLFPQSIWRTMLGSGRPIDIDMFNYDGRCFVFHQTAWYNLQQMNLKIPLFSLRRFNAASCSRPVSQCCRKRAEESGKYLFTYDSGPGTEETDVRSVY